MKILVIIIIFVLVFCILRCKIYKNKSNKLPKYIKSRLSSNLGITLPNCPYCGMKLQKFPLRKTKCKYCNNFMYARTRPYDNARIIIKKGQIEDVENEWNKKYFMLHYASDDFEKYETKLKKLRHTQKVNFNDVIWYKYEQEYMEACKNLDFDGMAFIHWDRGAFLLDEKRYKSALQEYLIFIFWSANGLGNFLDKSLWSKKEIDKHLKLHITFLGNPGACIEYLNLSEIELKEMLLNLPIEQGLPFPFSINDLIPYYLKAYKQHKLEKKIFESEYKIQYLTGHKIEGI